MTRLLPHENNLALPPEVPLPSGGKERGRGRHRADDSYVTIIVYRVATKLPLCIWPYQEFQAFAKVSVRTIRGGSTRPQAPGLELRPSK